MTSSTISDLRQALETIGKIKTQVYDMDVKTLCKKEYRLLEKAIEKIEKEKQDNE